MPGGCGRDTRIDRGTADLWMGSVTASALWTTWKRYASGAAKPRHAAER